MVDDKSNKDSNNKERKDDKNEGQNKDKKVIKLDLGCGKNRQKDFLGVDKIKLDTVDIVHDLEIFPWPFEDNSIDEIYCSHYIEHTNNLIKFVDEMFRVIKKDSKATLIAPYYASMRAWQDPTHKRAICEASFLYFNKKWREDNKLNHGDYDIKSDFDFSYGYMLTPDWATRNQEARDFAIRHYCNVVSDIQIILTKK